MVFFTPLKVNAKRDKNKTESHNWMWFNLFARLKGKMKRNQIPLHKNLISFHTTNTQSAFRTDFFLFSSRFYYLIDFVFWDKTSISNEM